MCDGCACTCDVGLLRHRKVDGGWLRQALDVAGRDLHLILSVPLERLQQHKVVDARNQLRHPLVFSVLCKHTYAGL